MRSRLLVDRRCLLCHPIKSLSKLSNPHFITIFTHIKSNKFDTYYIYNSSIRRMFEAGLHAYHSAVWEQKKPKCAESALNVAPVDLEHFSSALYIILIGITLSFSVLIVELIVHRWQKRLKARRESDNYKEKAFQFVH